VLVEGDDHNEPIADTARSILDGHIVLTRRLATAGHFPAIDVLESISRVETAVVPPERIAEAREVLRMLGALRDVRELIEIGAYVAGTNPDADRARTLMPRINEFLRQDMEDTTPAPTAWAMLDNLVNGAGA
jgi:flagellum-specific ATP synthase